MIPGKDHSQILAEIRQLLQEILARLAALEAK